MAVTGVVAEYNPFHLGHAHHLRETRRKDPAGVIVCCMSGNWVQRGECAVTHKWLRAKWAVLGGADLVVELPTLWAVSSAETFARGSVSLLAAAGADTLSFGCERADLPGLSALAACLNSGAFSQALAPRLNQGISFPAARQRAAAELVGEETARLLETPNNNLAVEYLRAMPQGMTPLAIPRESVHDGPLEGTFPSASALRDLLRAGKEKEAAPWLPQPWEGPAYAMERGERAMLTHLRRLTGRDWEGIPDSGDGLAQRLHAAAGQAGSLEELWALTKTRQVTLARVRRVALWAFLGLTAGDRPPAPGYLRVLAMNERGRRHLAALGERCSLPIITKPAQFREALAGESRLTDLFQTFAPQLLPRGEEFRHSPALL